MVTFSKLRQMVKVKRWLWSFYDTEPNNKVHTRGGRTIDEDTNIGRLRSYYEATYSNPISLDLSDYSKIKWNIIERNERK